MCILLLSEQKRQPKDCSLRTRLVHALEICCISVLLLDIPGLALDGHSFPCVRALLWFFDISYWIAHSLYFFLWVLFSDLFLFQSEKAVLRRMRLYILPLCVHCLILFLTPWTGWLFTLNAQNIYMTGMAYLLCLMPHFLYLAIVLAQLCISVRRNPDAQMQQRCLSMLAYILLPVCSGLLEIVAYGISWVTSTLALSLVMVYVSEQQRIISDKQLAIARAAEDAARMETKLTLDHITIMLSQIQPHFLYNSLCVIQDLCHDQAPEAERATIAFSRYLRGNLDSLKSNRLVLFEQELKHTQYYLTLEKIRFGDRLQVVYDLQTQAFKLPVLTLQPLVENAVRYGILQKEAGGIVRITTAETEKSFLVTVEDDGVGYDPNQIHDAERTHVGIENVCDRLRLMCGGSLAIISRLGEGTIATLTLPKGDSIHEYPCAG